MVVGVSEESFVRECGRGKEKDRESERHDKYS